MVCRVSCHVSESERSRVDFLFTLAREACGLWANKRGAICVEPTTGSASSFASLCKASYDGTPYMFHVPSSEVTLATFTSLLRSCRDANALSDGKHIHSNIVTCGFDHHAFTQNLLIQFYGTCGALEDARVLLSKMLQRNVFTWTFIIRAYAEQGHAKEAFQLLEQMKLEGSSMLTF